MACFAWRASVYPAVLQAWIVLLLFAFRSSESSSTWSPSKYYMSEDGSIRLIDKIDMLLSVEGGRLQHGNQIMVDLCPTMDHERFNVVAPTLTLERFSASGKLIRLKSNRDMCLNAEYGATAGNKIITWPCEHGGAIATGEAFVFRESGHIAFANNSDLCVQVEGPDLGRGSELIVEKCGKEMHGGNNLYQLFVLQDEKIRVQAKPEFHLNVAGADLSNTSKVVLWACDPREHELFDFADNGQVQLRADSNFCLHAENGLEIGSRVIVGPCSTGEQVPGNELFAYDRVEKVIYAKKEPDLAFYFAHDDGIILNSLSKKYEL